MADTQRRDIATAAIGGGLLASGGVMRHGAVRVAYPKNNAPKIHALAMLRKAPKGKKLFWGGSAIGALGLPPLAVGTTRAIRGDVQKKADNDKKPGFWREGLRGTRDALHQRAQNVTQPVPTRLRGLQLAAGAGAGAAGSLAARAALGRRGDALKPLLTPVAGGLAATGSVPLTNRYVKRRYPGYEVTPTGVRRRKADRKLPSTKASPFRPGSRSLRQDLSKADKPKGYLGSRTPYTTQRAVITAAGHPPIIGPFTSSAAAARYAPPGMEHKERNRQFLMGSGVGVPAGIGAAYGGAHLASRSDKAHHVAGKIVSTKETVERKARRAVGLGEKKGGGRMARATGRFLESPAGKPFRTPRGAVGGAAGLIGGRMIAGGVGGQTAISLNQRDQKRYNAAHHIEKSQTKREKHTLAERKRRSAALSTVGGTLGLTSLGLLATGHRSPAITLGTVGSGLGGINALQGARVQRQEAQAVDPVKKGFRDLPALHTVRAEAPKFFLAIGPNSGYKKIRHGKPAFRFEGVDIYRFHPRSMGVHKAAPLAITGSHKEHDDYIRRYGDRGPLPKQLSREERMRAYEARYVHHGGDKQNKWSRRATTGNRMKNAGLGVATAGTAAWLASRGKAGAKVAIKHPMLRHHAETATGIGAMVGGVGEMYSGYAHHRQSSYANSPGGVAASALRRMRENTPSEGT